MPQAHSLLWNYLWIAPNLVLLVVGFLLWKRGLARHFPAFLASTIIGGLGELAVYGADIAPFVSAPDFWRIALGVFLFETLLMFLVVGEVLSKLLVPYPSVSRRGRTLVSGLGSVLFLLGFVVAGFGHGDSPMRVISSYHLMELTVSVSKLGLVVSLSLVAAYFHLSWDRLSFGILLGLGVSAYVELAEWAVISNGMPSEHTRTLFHLLNMATCHLCVLDLAWRSARYSNKEIAGYFKITFVEPIDPLRWIYTALAISVPAFVLFVLAAAKYGRWG